MIDKAKAKEAIAEMCKNPAWKEVLSNAPGAANLRIGLAFYASKNLAEMDQKQKDEYREFREMLEKQLNAVELKYLAEEFKRMGVEAASAHYNELLSKMPQEEQTAAAEEYQEIVKKAAEGKNKVSDFMSKYGPDADKKGNEESPVENPAESKDAEKPEDEQKPESDGESAGKEDETAGEETQDEAPDAPNGPKATQSDPNAAPVAPSAQPPTSAPAPAEQSAGSTTAEQETLPGFSDDDMKAFLDRGKAMLTKGIRMKAKPQQ